jgi:hypothetical protein
MSVGEWLVGLPNILLAALLAGTQLYNIGALAVYFLLDAWEAIYSHQIYENRNYTSRG